MPRVSDEHKEQRREQIMAAAATVFLEHGFHKATMDDVCTAAGLSPGAVYRYFKSKDAIIEALGERSARIDKAFFAAFRTTADPVEDLVRLAEAYVRSIDAHETYAVNVQFWAEATRHPTVGTALGRAIAEAQQGLAEMVTEAGLGDALTANAVADSFVALMSGRTLMRALGMACPTDEYVAVVGAIVRSVLTRPRHNAGDQAGAHTFPGTG